MEILRLRDPIAEAVAYLGPYVPLEAGPFPDVPDGHEWGDLLITVVDVGGPGERDVVMDDARLMVEVSHADSVVASQWCRDIHGLLRAWPAHDSGVRFLKTVQRPTWSPDEVTRTPAYSTMVDLSFRADRREIKKYS